MPVIKSKMELEALVKEARESGFLAFDTETTGLNWAKDKLIGASFCFDGKTGYYIGSDLMPTLGKVLGDPKVKKAAHNAKFDLHFIRACGIRVAGTVYDTESLARIENENRINFKLKDLCRTFFGADAGDEQDDLKTWMVENKCEGNFAAVPMEILGPYACKDAVLVHRLFFYLKGIIDAKDAAASNDGIMTLNSLLDREAEVTRVATKLEEVGTLVDVAYLHDYKVKLLEQQIQAKAKLLEMTGVADFNPDSDQQVGQQMQRLGWISKERTAGGAPKVDKYALEDWDHPFSTLMQEYRRCGKLMSTYCEGIASRALLQPGQTIGTLHPDFRTNGAVTGRFSCTNPNMQNTDKKSEARSAFVVRPGYTNFYLDFKQIEICGFAYYANDKIMQDALWSGEDFHMLNAVAIFDKPASEITKDEREKAKTFNFALLYGAGEAKLAKMLHVSQQEAGMFKKRYMAKFPSVQKLRWRCEQAVRDKGFITNRFGRRRNLPAAESYKAMNALIQSWAADLLKESLIRVDTALIPYDANILLQIHDELVIQIKNDANQIPALYAAIRAMVSVGTLVDTVPIRVDVKFSSTNWYERKELDYAALSSMHTGGIPTLAEVVRELRLTPPTGVAQ